MNHNVTDHILNYPEPILCNGFKRLISCLLCILLFPQFAFAFDHSHKLFGAELKKYVSPDGVLYSQWKSDQEGLKKYLDSLSEISATDYEKFTGDEKKALWINAYNALAVKLILDHYPIRGQNPNYPAESIRQIPNTWDAINWKIAGKNETLYSIAHDILRRERDCRTHFAIAPAARGGGALLKEAYDARTINKQLEKSTEEYMKRPENLHCDIVKFTITVSRIFKWFPLDFLVPNADGKIPMPPPKDDDVVRNYVQQFFSGAIKSKLKGKTMQIIYGPYDWTLNDAANKDSKPTETIIND